MKRTKLKIAIIATVAIALTGCGGQSGTEAYGDNSAEISVADDNAKEYGSKDVENAIYWMTGIWNNCCDIKSYVEEGKSCSGREMDIDFYMETVKGDYEKKNEYDSIIHSLDDSVAKQKVLIESWDKCIEQAAPIIEKAINKTPIANDKDYEINLDLFQQYNGTLRDTFNEILYPDGNYSSIENADDKFVLKKK